MEISDKTSCIFVQWEVILSNHCDCLKFYLKKSLFNQYKISVYLQTLQSAYPPAALWCEMLLRKFIFNKKKKKCFKVCTNIVIIFGDDITKIYWLLHFFFLLSSISIEGSNVKLLNFWFLIYLHILRCPKHDLNF